MGSEPPTIPLIIATCAGSFGIWQSGILLELALQLMPCQSVETVPVVWVLLATMNCPIGKFTVATTFEPMLMVNV